MTLTDKLPKHFKDSMEEMKKSLTAISEGFCLTSKGSGLVFRNERYMSDYDETFKAVLLRDILRFRNAYIENPK